MSIGVFSEGRRSTDLAQKIAPSLSGQRAVRKDLFDQVPKLEQSGYGVEVALTHFAEKHDVEIVRVPLPTVSQVLKEEKRGLVKGLSARLKMYWDIMRSLRISLVFFAAPRGLRTPRARGLVGDFFGEVN